jgi:hypothetical protein
VLVVSQLSALLVADLTIGGAGRDPVPAARGVVGVDLHDLDDELVRPGLTPDADRPGDRDVREPARRDLHPRGVRGPRAAAGGRLRDDPAARNGFAVVACEPDDPLRPSLVRIFLWSLWLAPIWVAGAFVPHDARIVVWLFALLADYAGPLVGPLDPRPRTL